MTPWPDGLALRRRTPTFRDDTVPDALLADHTTRAGVWGRIIVEQGVLGFWLEGCEPVRLAVGDVGVIPPQVPHRVEPEGPVAFHVEFWSLPEVPR